MWWHCAGALFPTNPDSWVKITNGRSFKIHNSISNEFQWLNKPPFSSSSLLIPSILRLNCRTFEIRLRACFRGLGNYRTSALFVFLLTETILNAYELENLLPSVSFQNLWLDLIVTRSFNSEYILALFDSPQKLTWVRLGFTLEPFWAFDLLCEYPSSAFDWTLVMPWSDARDRKSGILWKWLLFLGYINPWIQPC